MGWAYTHREAGQSTESFISNELGLSKHGEIRAFASTAKAAYIAYKPNGKQYTTCIVIAHNFVSRAEFNYGYKDMDEGMGPIESECPLSVLKKLSPLSECDYGEKSTKWAQDWRDRCYANAAKKQHRPKLREGSIITFAEPVKFTDGAEYQQMEVKKVSPLSLAPVGGYGWYRIPRRLLDTATIA